MCAFIFATVDQQPGWAAVGPHFTESDFLLAHKLLKRSQDGGGKPLG